MIVRVLRELGSLYFRPDVPTIPRLGRGVAVGIDYDEKDFTRRRVTVLAGVPAPAEVAGILCDVYEGGIVVATYETDTHGQFVVAGCVPGREYRLVFKDKTT